MEKTNALRILEREHIPHTVRTYEGDITPEGIRNYGVQLTLALGLDPERGFKTLAARGTSGLVYVYELPAAASLDLKKAAKAVGEKAVELLPVREICEVTGYVRGGCSPVGMKKNYPVVFHKTAIQYESIYISAGKIGLQVEVSPLDLIRLLHAQTADIIM